GGFSVPIVSRSTILKSQQQFNHEIRTGSRRLPHSPLSNRAESMPAAVGLFVFAGGDPLETIVGGTNIGNDTDTIAAIAGSMAGALHGFDAVPADMFETFKAANKHEADVEALAKGLTTIAARRV
ncbi:MAG: ADP-ribosylglycohydrolase family protein, partial [Chloroflexota bacterium]